MGALQWRRSNEVRTVAKHNGPVPMVTLSSTASTDVVGFDVAHFPAHPAPIVSVRRFLMVTFRSREATCLVA
jgi:hypothetical protein